MILDHLWRSLEHQFITLKIKRMGHLGGSGFECLPSAQVVIPGSRDRVPHQTPAKSLLLPLPVSLPLSLCVCVSLMNK